MKVYTRTGDGGETGLVGQARVPKTDPRIASVGSLDELNATIGCCLIHPLPDEVKDNLVDAQSRLFDIGATVATDQPTESAIHAADVLKLEASMDRMTDALPPLRAFILPGGSAAAAAIHVARTTARKTEREMLALHEIHPISGETRRWLNRLSDWLFVAARYTNHMAGIADVEWHPRKS